MPSIQKSSSISKSPPSGQAAHFEEALHREAKKLHRLVQTGSVSYAMPIIRRLCSAGIFYDKSLTEIFAIRSRIRRKHLFRLLAVEAGFSSWEQFKPHIQHCNADASFRELLTVGGDESDDSVLKIWFSTELEAQDYVSANGGRVVKHREQAMVVLSKQALFRF